MRTGTPSDGQIVCFWGKGEHRQGLAGVCRNAQRPARNLLWMADRRDGAARQLYAVTRPSCGSSRI